MIKIKSLAIFVLLVIFLTGCDFEKPHVYYDKFRNTNLNYTWNFSTNFNDSGGHTEGQSHFNLRKYGFLQEFIGLNPTYEFSYKHEEGHIYHNQKLNISNFDDFEINSFHKTNLTDREAYRQYVISVSEGIADYYAAAYFNNSASKKYVRSIVNTKWPFSPNTQHYRGLCYVTNLIWKDGFTLKKVIFELGTKKQYFDYLEYLSKDIFLCEENNKLFINLKK